MSQSCIYFRQHTDDHIIADLCVAFPGRVFIGKNRNVVAIKNDNEGNCFDVTIEVLTEILPGYVHCYEGDFKTEYYIKSVKAAAEGVEVKNVLAAHSSFESAINALNEMPLKKSDYASDDCDALMITRKKFIKGRHSEVVFEDKNIHLMLLQG